MNEVFASTLHKQQKFSNYTTYSLAKVQTTGGVEGIGCLSYDFCSENIECISAWELLQTMKIRQKESLFYPLKKVCLSIGMQEQQFHDFIDYQIMTDYLLTNTDRHMNNIAIMRNPDTLELLGFAPIFDSGNSMFYHIPYEGLKNVRFREIKTHSFIEKESKLLQYVRNRDLVHIGKAQMDFSIYEKDILERHIRIPELERLYQKKLNLLEAFQRGKDIWK